MGSLHAFWQQFPKEWEVTDRALVMHLWSPRGGELDFSADGFRAFCGKAGEKYFFSDRMVKSTSPTDHLKFGGIDAILRGEGTDRD